MPSIRSCSALHHSPPAQALRHFITTKIICLQFVHVQLSTILLRHKHFVISSPPRLYAFNSFMFSSPPFSSGTSTSSFHHHQDYMPSIRSCSALHHSPPAQALRHFITTKIICLQFVHVQLSTILLRHKHFV